MALRGRVVASTNGAVAVALVALLAVFAIVAKPPAPPGIAEFAPKASKPITKAPAQQAAQNGQGPGVCVPGVPCAETGGRTPMPVPTVGGGAPHPPGVATNVQCYSWPDGSTTQTFDPQSPPCVADWVGRASGNGGSTAHGVNKTEIRVGIPNFTQSDDRAHRALLTYFNTRFQLYDRKVTVVDVGGSGGGANDAQQEKASAEQLAANDVFAALPLSVDDTDSATYTRTLNGHGVLVVEHSSSLLTEARFRSAEPRLWSYGMPAEVIERAAARLYCGSLKGRRAGHAGSDYQRTVRKPVILLGNTDESGTVVQQPDPAPLRTALKACGVDAPVLTMPEHTQTNPEWNSFVVHLRQTGYTTLMLLGDEDSRLSLELAADRIQYQPEYFLTGLADDYNNNLMPVPSQEGHSFGLATFNKYLPVATQPWMRAVLTVDPTYQFDSLRFAYGWNRTFYEEMLTLYSGLQMAGPHLTASAFSEGLHETRFPNPGADSSPTYQARVGFGDGDHTMVDTLGVWWVDVNQTNPESGRAATTNGATRPSSGGYCWYGGGKRWAPDAIPAHLELFTGRCR